jgi:hypothetical protein
MERKDWQRAMVYSEDFHYLRFGTLNFRNGEKFLIREGNGKKY